MSFGRAIGQMRGTVMDVHGAGAQRSDRKTGRPAIGHGPQGDAERVSNFVRCVRGGGVTVATAATGRQAPSDRYPRNVDVVRSIGSSGPGLGVPPRASNSGFGKHFVARLDRDGDGKVSRREFDGPPDQFDVLDANHDGHLSAAEAPEPPSHFGR